MGGCIIGIVKPAFHVQGAALDHGGMLQLSVKDFKHIGLIGLFAGDETALGQARGVTVEGDDGLHVLAFRHDEAEDEYVVTSDRYSGPFTVASYIAEQILVEATELLPAVSEDEAAADAETMAEDPTGGSAVSDS